MCRIFKIVFSKIETWIFENIGGRIYACVPIDDFGEIVVQLPITNFIPAWKLKKIKSYAKKLYPNDELYYGVNKVLKAHGLIIR